MGGKKLMLKNVDKWFEKKTRIHILKSKKYLNFSNNTFLSFLSQAK